MHQQIRFAVAVLLVATAVALRGAAPLRIETNDVVAWVGGSDVAAARDSAHLATLFSTFAPSARFRNFGWEGDTVFAQPRDVNFPPLLEHLKRARATVVLLQYGRAEALSGRESIEKFHAACEHFADDCSRAGMRVAFITPAPFEAGGGLLPDLTSRNSALAAHANAVRSLASARQWSVIDAFSVLSPGTNRNSRLTSDGLNLTPAGHARFASAVASGLECSNAFATTAVNEEGAWENSRLEALRQAVLEKERLWFNYWRPQNWAFLGGDRVTQPSSRDHRNPNIRWFPAEMEKYVPLLRAQEEQIEIAARAIGKGQS